MVGEISAAELHERLNAGKEIQVIDVRSERAYRRGHIPGAENVPITRFTDAIENHDWTGEIVVACPHGKSSLQAARLLEAYEETGEKTRIANLADGYDAWEHGLESGPEKAGFGGTPDESGGDPEGPDPPF
jgi:rhodanese-related sulfurtransferase